MDNRNVLATGTMLQGGRYRIERHLGSGGFGNTYEVTDVTTGAPFAVKEFYLRGVNERVGNTQSVVVSNADNTPEFESQKVKFRKEALRLCSIRHPNVVGVHDLFEENGTAYYVMDYLHGESLSARMRSQQRPFTEQEVVDIMRQLTDALGAVHAQNIWHLDLKPGNVIIDEQGHVVLIDFGASKQYHDAEGHSLSTSTGLCYTPGYAPTEQIAGETSRMGPWTDLYALGATAYNLLTRQTPPSVSAIQDGEGFEFPAGTSTAMQRLVRWLMAPNRKNRPQTVGEVRGFIDRNLVDAAGSTATVVMAQHEAERIDDDDDDDDTDGNRRKLWVIPAIIAAACVAVALFFLLKGNGTKKSAYDDDDDYDDDMEYYDDEAALEEDDDYYDDYYGYDSTMAVFDSVAMPAQEAAAPPAAMPAAPTRQEERRRTEEPRNPVNVEPAPAPAEPVIVAETPATTPAADDNSVFEVVEQQPTFAAGNLGAWLGANIRYPAVAEENGIQGQVICQFIVEKDGSISNVTVLRGADPSLDREAVRVIKSMPRWNPGKNGGQPVRVKFTLPIKFSLQ